MLKIAIVFPIFNGLNYTKKCLSSLFEENKISRLEAIIEIVITDDGSTDGSFDWIRTNYPMVHLVKGDGSLWWSGGINKAVEYAKKHLSPDYTLWWNNDIIASEDYFENLLKILSNTESRIILGSKIYIAGDEKRIWSMGGTFDPITGNKIMIGADCPDSKEFLEVQQVDWLTGMGSVIPIGCYDEIGMLDEKTFPQYHGDSDFTLRAKKAGFAIRVQPDLVIYNDIRHTGLKHGESFRKLLKSLFSIRSNYNIARDYYFYRKHSTSIKAFKVPLMKYFRYIGGFLKWKVLNIFGKRRS